MKTYYILRLTLFSLVILSVFFMNCAETEEPVTVQEESVIGIGAQVSGFRANDDNGNVWKSDDHLGSSYLIVYFYPAAMTGGCTLQACSYRDNSSELNDLDVEVVGVSGDSINNLRIFREAHNLNFTLLSDINGVIAGIFGVPLKDGGTITRTVDGAEVSLERSYTTSRWTFILDKAGKIIYKDTEVNAENDSKNVIEFIRTL